MEAETPQHVARNYQEDTKLEGDPRYRLGKNIFQADSSNNTLYVIDILTIW